MIKQRRTYSCVKCHHWTEIISEIEEPKLILDRCEKCGYSAKEARSKVSRLKRVNNLLRKAKDILQMV